MPISNKIIAEIVVSLSHAVEANDQDLVLEVHRLLWHAMRARKKGNFGKSVGKAAIATSSETGNLFESVDNLRERLSDFETREASREYILRHFPRKIDIIKACRAVRVPVAKEDDFDNIVEKLIDATIGYKLRSRAIRGDGVTDR